MSLIANIRYQIADLTLNTQLGTVCRANEELTLPQLSYNLLCVLVQRAPAIVSQDDLMRLVWGEQVVSDETLKQRIKLLRQVLNDSPQSPKYIESVRGRGYRCVADVTKTMIKPHDSINLRLHDRLPVSFLQSSEEYWRMVSIFFLLIFTVFSTVVALNYYSPDKQPTPQVTPPTGISPQAIAAYQKGRVFYLRYQPLDNDMAIKSYLAAVEMAPGYAMAFAGLADAYSQGVFQFSADESWQKKALEAAYDAIMLNDQLAQSYKSLGTAHYVNGHISQSLSANLKAAALDPTYLEAQANLGYIYSERGQLKNALEQHDKVYKLNPNNHVNWFHIALTSARLGNRTKAKIWYEKVLNARPSYHLATFNYSRLLLQQGNIDAASQLLITAERQSPDSVNVLKGLTDLHLLSGQISQAKPWIHKLKLLSSGENRQYAELLSLLTLETADKSQLQLWYDKHANDYNERPFSNIQLAIAATVLGNTDMAFRHLTQAIELGWLEDHYIRQLTFFKPLQQHHKFARVLALLERKRLNAISKR
ncbi:MAG: winged helix-turn-helix domain-containing protein [Algicola sp.]|nr:winged helix-turn-helix domain-containing protein [Algicola sp.]